MLVDEGGRAIGTEAKATVHHAATPLHLAFSSYVVDTAGRVLLTQRAADKPTWPGAWTNSCCGHPLPGEPVQDAVRRRLADELGIVADAIELVLPEFRYRAEMPTGVVENELCPVYRVWWTGDPTPDPTEVASYRWVDWPTLRAVPACPRGASSNWTNWTAWAQGPPTGPLADAALLPPAARL